MICKFKPSIPLKPGRTCVQDRTCVLCGFAAPPPPGVKEQQWKLLSNMVQDDMFWGKIWCLYNGVRWAFIQEAWTCQQTWIYSMEIERAGKASDMLKENHSLEDNLRSHKICKFYACCPRKTWQGTIAKQIHTSVQVWISKLDTAWKRFQCLSKAVQTYKVTTVQQKMLSHSVECKKPCGMNWYHLHHLEHFRSLSGILLSCFHSQKMSRHSIPI